jgi:uncharacterized OB-fold protein
MSITVKCPGGHTLKVKDRYAGMIGRCPKCGVAVEVPDRSPPLEQELMDVLAEDGEDDRPVYDDDLESSGVSLVVASSTGAKSRISKCPRCSQRVQVPENNICPNCGAYYTYWT